MGIRGFYNVVGMAFGLGMESQERGGTSRIINETAQLFCTHRTHGVNMRRYRDKAWEKDKR